MFLSLSLIRWYIQKQEMSSYTMVDDSLIHDCFMLSYHASCLGPKNTYKYVKRRSCCAVSLGNSSAAIELQQIRRVLFPNAFNTQTMGIWYTDWNTYVNRKWVYSEEKWVLMESFQSCSYCIDSRSSIPDCYDNILECAYKDPASLFICLNVYENAGFESRKQKRHFSEISSRMLAGVCPTISST